MNDEENVKTDMCDGQVTLKGIMMAMRLNL